ncbi:MAG: transcriptional regulator [Clostridia bacterium]|nr:transcriptional regulator [Clostridia bacterium]
MKERFETFTVLIAKISRNIKRIKNQEMAEYELRGAHISCLYYLYVAESLTATEISERCEEDKATISRAVDHLETNGYVTCESKSAKRYNTPIMLTEKGRLIGKEICEKIDLILDEVGMGLSDKERIEFYRCLTIISDNLERVTRS